MNRARAVAYDPFPKTGLVKQHERFIRDEVDRFCRAYPRLRHQDVLFRAVELAIAAERTFKPELGANFKTHVTHRLKELHRLHDKQEQAEGVLIYRTDEDLAHEKAEEEGEPTDPIDFAGGGNGVRLVFDLQWWEALLSDLISRVLHPTTERRHRLKLGLQLRKSDNAIEAHNRLSADLPQVVKQQPPDSELMGWIRAVIDHDIRRQREADAEAQKRLNGDHSPTFLEAIRNAVDLKFYKGRRPPRFLPKWMPMARLDDMWSHHPNSDTEVEINPHEVTAAPDTSSTYEKELQAAMEAVKAVRPTLTNTNEIAVLNALEAVLEGRTGGGLDRIAKDLGMLKGTVSKVARRLAGKFRVRKVK
jgi:hypothetical protein